MNDQFLYALREPPRAAFAAELRQRLRIQERPFAMLQNLTLRRLAWATLALSGLLLGVFAFSPAARASVRQVLEAFNIGGIQFQPDPELPQALATLAVASTGAPEENAALNAVKAKVPFAFKTPTWTPDGFILTNDGATIIYSDPESTQVMQVLLRWDRGEQVLFFYAVNPNGPERTYLVAPEATVEEVLVSGQPASFTITPLDDADQPGYSLKWVAEGVQYTLQGRAGQVTLAEMVQIAESLQ
ncbi:MAG: DUF4367 domain-containing protein [Anaerolineales bacterium]|nr:DUF4367 domain-containing protein [Anaerolineales bacterium]